MSESLPSESRTGHALPLIAAAGLLGVALLLLALVRLLDGSGLGALADPRGFLLGLDHAVLTDRIAGAAEVVAGVLAILITVVAIVVELAANRYTHRITQLFIREPINAGIVGLYILTTILCLWLSTQPPPTAPEEAVLPAAGLVVCMALVTLCLLSLLPYLSFLFRFISPLRVIGRIRQQAEAALQPSRRRDMDRARAAVIEATEELQDIARGTQDGGDRGISMASVDALAEFVRYYARLKPELPESWLKLSVGIAHDPDFVALDPHAARTINDEGIWLEVKVLRQYFALFSECLGRARDVASLIALNTRLLAESGDLPLRLSLQFFNSYLRAAINSRDLRTAYYVLNQYRTLAEARMEARDTAAVTAIADHLRYYGRLGYEFGQPFLLEVAAYDISLLVEYAATHDFDELDPLLDLLLEVDAESEHEAQEEPLRGVRRAQIQLATFFLERQDEAHARRIFEDLRGDPPERLQLIHEELLAETNPQYREFTDRGVNFSYLEPSRRDELERFFGWMETRE